jgi:hypothetical protein
VISHQLGLRSPLPELRKASAWGYFRGGKRLPGIDADETTMFLIPGGEWFWYIPLPDDMVSVGLVANPEYVFSEGDDLEAAFTREVRRCAPLADRLSAATRVGPVRGSRHLAYLNRRTCGDGWVMIGDARASLDPIYLSATAGIEPHRPLNVTPGRRVVLVRPGSFRAIAGGPQAAGRADSERSSAGLAPTSIWEASTLR